jgi:hypothetical protein
LAVSRDTSNGPDWKDIALALMEFQESNRLDLELKLMVAGSKLKPDLVVELTTPLTLDHEVEVKRSVCVRLRIGRLNVRTLEAAIMSSMYALDAELAEQQGLFVPKSEA